MYSKTLLVFFLLCLLSVFTHGQRANKFFRHDYTYIEASQGFYKVHTAPKNFTEARRGCALEGATLYYPENKNEARAVASFWKTTQPTLNSWVYGGISALIAKGVFETVDHKLVTAMDENWHAGEPNDALDIEDCGWLLQDGSYWDGRCDVKYPYICKKTLRSLEWDYNCNMSNLDYRFNEDIGKCYKFHTTPLTWTEAYAVCSAEQSRLAVITDKSEADYLAQLGESTAERRGDGNYLRGLFHMGFHNRFNEGWQTVKGTALVDDAEFWYGKYQPGPNDPDQCGSMFFNGLLTQINCDLRSFFICEHEGVTERKNSRVIKKYIVANSTRL
uniref:IML25 n=1 Tax=Mythimna separata TaxID=271217 RepID=A0A8F3C7E0_MYTSE|nr:IML25 [Mythimna separata]